MEVKEINEVGLKKDAKGKYILLDAIQFAEEWNIDQYQFLLESKDDKDLCIGLDTVLQCLQIAQEKGLVEPLSLDWWLNTMCKLGYEDS